MPRFEKHLVSTPYAEFLQAHALTQVPTVQSYEINAQKVWLKKAAQHHSTWIYLPLKWLSGLFGLTMLVPVPNRGGIEAIACELKRIKTLKQAGITVPEILAEQENAFLLKDNADKGSSVIQFEYALQQQPTTEARLALFQKAINAIENIHQKNCYLSEAFARNILIDAEHNFSFIDFETDPGEYMSQQDCYTRDWLCFVFSSAHRFPDHELDDAIHILRTSLTPHPKTLQDIGKIGSKISWLLKINPDRFGNDGKRLKRSIYMLNRLYQTR